MLGRLGGLDIRVETVLVSCKVVVVLLEGVGVEQRNPRVPHNEIFLLFGVETLESLGTEVSLGSEQAAKVLVAYFGEFAVVVVSVEVEEVASELEGARERGDENSLLSDPHQVRLFVHVDAQFLTHEADGLGRYIGLGVLKMESTLRTKRVSEYSRHLKEDLLRKPLELAVTLGARD